MLRRREPDDLLEVREVLVGVFRFLGWVVIPIDGYHVSIRAVIMIAWKGIIGRQPGPYALTVLDNDQGSEWHWIHQCPPYILGRCSRQIAGGHLGGHRENTMPMSILDQHFQDYRWNLVIFPTKSVATNWYAALWEWPLSCRDFAWQDHPFKDRGTTWRSWWHGWYVVTSVHHNLEAALELRQLWWRQDQSRGRTHLSVQIRERIADQNVETQFNMLNCVEPPIWLDNFHSISWDALGADGLKIIHGNLFS